MSIFKYLTFSQVFFMELRQLKSLCLIAQHCTVKEAGKRSFLTSSAVSLQIKMLEKELGIKLFEHVGKKL
ncbi:MAG: LysR family transcriptional regulator, partial [Deltaproteobacteria bacterium]